LSGPHEESPLDHFHQQKTAAARWSDPPARGACQQLFQALLCRSAHLHPGKCREIQRATFRRCFALRVNAQFLGARTQTIASFVSGDVVFSYRSPLVRRMHHSGPYVRCLRRTEEVSTRAARLNYVFGIFAPAACPDCGMCDCRSSTRVLAGAAIVSVRSRARLLFRRRILDAPCGLRVSPAASYFCSRAFSARRSRITCSFSL